MLDLLMLNPPSASGVEKQAPYRWPELDEFRGLAAVLMLLNHAAVTWVGVDVSSLTLFLMFLGSFAPALFFTAAGVGRGFQSFNHYDLKLCRVLAQCAVLILADAALWMSPVAWVGLDFLGFIALSILILALISSTRHPVLICLGLCSAFLMLRFALAPWLALPAGNEVFLATAHFVLGDTGVAGASYPISPWLSFPLIGFVLGRYAARRRQLIQGAPGKYVAIFGLFAAVVMMISALFYLRGMVFFRWGTVSFAYFTLATAVVAAAIATVLLSRRNRSYKFSRTLSLAGNASLIFVPVHYVLVACVGQLVTPSGPASFTITVGIVAFLAFYISRALSAWFSHFSHLTFLTPLVLLVIGSLLTLLAFVPLAGLDLPTRMAAQLLACFLFVLIAHSRTGGG